MKKFKLLIFGCFMGIGIGIAQPPPPHPGGSGNQGAALPAVGIVLTALAASGYTANKLGKRS